MPDGDGTRDDVPLSVFEHLRPYRGRVAAGVGYILLTNAFDKGIPWLLQVAIDALRAGRLTKVRDACIAVVVCAVIMGLVRTRSRMRLFDVARDIEYRLRAKVLDRIHVLGPAFFRRMPTGDIMSRAINDLGQVRLVLGFGALNLVNTVVAYVSCLGLMLATSPKVTLLALLPYPLFVLVARGFSRTMFKRSIEAQAALGELSTRMQEHLAGVRVVRAYAVEGHEAARFEDASRRALRANMGLAVVRGSMGPTLTLVSSLSTLIVLFVGGSMLFEGRLSVGEFAKLLMYLGQMLWPSLALGFVISVVARGRASYGRVRELLVAAPSVVESPHARPAKDGGALEVKHLSFAYGGRKVLDDVSLEVPAQGSLAVVGPTGSGKSTLAALLPRLLPTPPGTVKLDGDDVTELRLRDLRKRVGYAQQEPFLFSTTIAKNIALGLADPQAPDAHERVRAAAKEAAVLEEIDAMPEGFETVVGERGVQLSGGQKQRVSLARALLAEPTVLVLDDPLSAVDARTEAQILSALDRAGEGRTLVLVTHRIAAASRADRVVVLAEGRVIERGTHAELVAKGGLYAGLARRQQLEKELSSL